MPGLANARVRAGISAIVVRASGAGLAFAVAIVMARLMGPAGYGAYSFAIALATLLTVLAQTGLPTLLVRETAAYRLNRQWGDLRGMLRRAVIVAAGASAVACLAVVAVGAAFDQSIPASDRDVVAWSLLLVPVMALTAIAGAAMRGMGRVIRGQIPEQIGRPGLLLALAASIVLFGSSGPLPAGRGMQLHVLAAVTALVMSWWLLRTTMPSELRSAAATYEHAPVWRRSMVPFALLTVFQVVIRQADTLILGLFVPSAEVGIYRVAWQGATLVNLILFAIGLTIEPQVARLVAAGRREELQKLVRASGRIAFALAVVTGLAFVVTGEWLIGTVFGAGYADAYLPLLILVLGQVLFAVSGWSGIVLNMTGNERQTARFTAYAAFCNVAANFALIPYFGVYGAAWAAAATMFVWKVALALSARKRTGINTLVFSGFSRKGAD